LGALLGITQRVIRVKHACSGGRLSPRKLIPVNAKTLGDYLLLKRIEADLSQPEVAQKAGVSTRTVRKWEHDRARPTEDHWQALAHILRLDEPSPQAETQRQSRVLGFTQSKTIVGRNPNKPDTDVPIPARATVKFRAGKEMRAEVLKLTPKH
jgi:transcriptional regulator with XRE-family HTH domain